VGSVEEFVLQIYSDVAGYFNLTDYPKITIKKVPGHTACAKGIFKPSIEIDRAWASGIYTSQLPRDREDMVFIIAHELAHIKHGDNLFRFSLLTLFCLFTLLGAIPLAINLHWGYALTIPAMFWIYWRHGITFPERYADQTASDVLDIWRSGEDDGI
jgi:hypothetical protein